mmetsp:Transcript_27257/g.92789  ORF Transcript_27257/g.92789 Transcript_27257/m.92789 type:complete len:201 (+) Transcript_27257:245-847(+)
MENTVPISSSVLALPSSRPKRRRTTSHSRSLRAVRRRPWMSLWSDLVSARSSGKAAASARLSESLASLPAPPVPADEPLPETRTVASMDMVWRSQERSQSILVVARSSLPASSSSVHSRPSSAPRSRVTFFMDWSWSWTWTGRRIVRLWSAMARMTACLIHHVAYVENLKPFSGSNFSTARVRPKVPSWMTSWKWSPRCW